MGRITKELNSSQWTSGNIDSWWYNISSPSKLSSQDIIQLNLWDEKNQKLIEKIVLDLKENWLSRIEKGSTHIYRGREICKVHIQRRHGTNRFSVYFGKKEDGTYPLHVGFNPNLEQGQELSNSELSEIFGCGIRGGMRRSQSTNTLVVISDHTKAFYDDRWKGEILHYTGMGLTGNQSLTRSNKTLYRSNDNGINVYLFEVFEKGRYIYQGQVRLAEKPYQEEQYDFKGSKRTVWMFPLRLVHAKYPAAISEDTFERNLEIREKHVRKVSDTELVKRISMLGSEKKYRKVVSSRFMRNEYITEFVKRKAKGKCQLCNNVAPFFDRNKQPYLEVHHIKWLSRGGEDSVDNSVALCPNCHRKMHVLDLQKDKTYLYSRARD